MDRFTALTRGAQLMLVAGVLLLIDTFLAWQEVELLDIAVASENAWSGFWGVMLGLLTIALVAWLVVRLLAVEIRLPVSEAMVGAVLGTLILLFALIKVLTDDFSTIWAWIGLALAAAIAVGAWLQVQEAGGVDALRSEANAMRGDGSRTAAADTTPPPPAATPPPPADTAAPPAAEPRPTQPAQAPVAPAPPGEPAAPPPPVAPRDEPAPAEPELPPGERRP